MESISVIGKAPLQTDKELYAAQDIAQHFQFIMINVSIVKLLHGVSI